MRFLDIERRKSLLVGGGIILVFAFGLIALWCLSYLPGAVGTTFSLITGFLWTPLIMEPILFVGGLFSILILNHHRKKTEGAEIVLLETLDDSATLRTAAGPDALEILSHEEFAALTASIRKAAAEGDHKEVMRLMLNIPDAELDSEEVIAIRLQLAIANRDPNHIRGLSRKLRELNPEHALLQENT